MLMTSGELASKSLEWRTQRDPRPTIVFMVAFFHVKWLSGGQETGS